MNLKNGCFFMSSVGNNLPLPLPDLVVRDAARDEKRAAAKDDAKKGQKAEQRVAAELESAPPPPRPQAKVPDRPKAEPPRQPDQFVKQEPPKAPPPEPKRAADPAADALRRDAAALRAMEKPVVAGEAATPEAPPKVADAGQAEINNGQEKPGGKNDGTKAFDPSAGNKTAKSGSDNAGIRQPGDPQRTVQKQQPGQSTTGHEVAAAPEGEKRGGGAKASFAELLSGRPQPKEMSEAKSLISSEPGRAAAGDKNPTGTTAALGQMALPVALVNGTAPQSAKPEGLFAKLAQAWQKALGKQLPPAPKHTPPTALAKGGNPQAAPAKTHQLATAKSPGASTAPEGQEGPGQAKQPAVRTLLTSLSEKATAEMNNFLSAVATFKNMGNGGQPLAAGATAAMAKGAKDTFAKIRQGEGGEKGVEKADNGSGNLYRVLALGSRRERSFA